MVLPVPADLVEPPLRYAEPPVKEEPPLRYAEPLRLTEAPEPALTLRLAAGCVLFLLPK